MNNRERALELADSVIEQLESGSTAPDTRDVMGYALILVLADIGEQLEEIQRSIDGIWADGIGVA